MFKVSQCAAFAVAVACCDMTVAAANPVVRYPGAAVAQRHAFSRRANTPALSPPHRVPITTADRLRAQAGGWQEVKAPAPFGSDGAGTSLLMTDGTVMVQANDDSPWYSLTPDKSGSYVNGTWTQKASLQSGYGPLYFASAVLADGKLVINGGEYNFGNQVESNQGSIYDPLANTWTPVSPPSGFSRIGDAQSAVLSNDIYMLGNCCGNTQALFNEQSLTFTLTGSGKADGNSEEGWTLLPNGEILTADTADEPNSELYNPMTGSWTSAGTVPVDLVGPGLEIGPQILGLNGDVLVVGGSGHNAVYNSNAGKWIAAPNSPTAGGQQLDSNDGPATLLTNGTVMVPLSPGEFQTPASFYIFNGRQFVSIAAPPNAPNDSSYNLRLLMLPTGQVMETDGSNDVEIYTGNTSPNQAVAPAITSVPSMLTHGSTYQLSGRRLNGFSQTNFYGDDAQQATNYPLVAIVNDSTHHVAFARTHDHSFMGVASQAVVSTKFDVPQNIETGPSKLIVVANGIHSAAVNVVIQ